jgi:hypothetical protein
MIEAMFPGQTFRVECTFLDAEDPEMVEAELLAAYLKDHCELPPANHNSRAASAGEPGVSVAVNGIEEVGDAG